MARRARGMSMPTPPAAAGRTSSAAAKALGSTGEVVFLGWRDGELDSGLEQRSLVALWIRRLRPDVVLGHDPWRRYRLHPDHRHAGCSRRGIVAARIPTSSASTVWPTTGRRPCCCGRRTSPTTRRT
jgi:LmbE family N-acetylglucosaminyl deacetylase